MGIQESLKRQNNWGNSLMSSSPLPPSLGEMKTGSRRRNVIKEDLVAEEDEAASGAGSVIVTVSSTCGPVTVLVQPWTANGKEEASA